jgi:hypothetical protein
LFPDEVAKALIVSECVTKIGEEYTVEDVVGVDPSVVYRMVAPDVASDSATDCEPFRVVPLGGLNVGAAVFPTVPPPPPASAAPLKVTLPLPLVIVQVTVSVCPAEAA